MSFKTNKVFLANKQAYFTSAFGYLDNNVFIDRWATSQGTFSISDRTLQRSFTFRWTGEDLITGLDIRGTSNNNQTIYEFWRELIDYKPSWLP